jgi:hypothetical protein
MKRPPAQLQVLSESTTMASNTKAGSEVLEANDRRVATAKKLVAFTQKNLDSRTKALEVWRNERKSQLKASLKEVAKNVEKELLLTVKEREKAATKAAAFARTTVDSRAKSLELGITQKVWREVKESLQKALKEEVKKAMKEVIRKEVEMVVKEMESLIEALELARKENEDAEAELKDAEKCRDKAHMVMCSVY